MPAKKQQQLIPEVTDVIPDEDPKQVTPIRMIHEETKKVAMVHPLEQLNYYKGGYRKAVKQDV